MRQRYRCIRCGLEVEGRIGNDGRVYAYDRAGCDTKTARCPLPCVCISCSTGETPNRAGEVTRKGEAK